MAAQDLDADGVEGAEPGHALDGAAHQRADALLHLARGLVGEGHGEDLGGARAARAQNVGNAGGQHAGLARAGARQHQDRPIERLHGGPLLRIEICQIRWLPARLALAPKWIFSARRPRRRQKIGAIFFDSRPLPATIAPPCRPTMRPVGLPTGMEAAGGKFLVQTCAQLCDNRAKMLWRHREGWHRPANARRKGPFMRFPARSSYGGRRAACGMAASRRDDPRAGWADEQFFRHHCRLSDHRHRRAVCDPLLHRLERLSRRVRGGGHASAWARGESGRRRQSAPAADALFPLRARCALPTAPPTSRTPSSGPTASPSSCPCRRCSGARSRPTRSSCSGRCCEWHSTRTTAGTGKASARRSASAAYMPSNVALTSVKIADGVLALHGPDGMERTRFDGSDRRALGAGARWALPLPRHLRQGPRRAGGQDMRRRDPSPTAPCGSRPCCGSATAHRPTPWMGA